MAVDNGKVLHDVNKLLYTFVVGVVPCTVCPEHKLIMCDGFILWPKLKLKPMNNSKLVIIYFIQRIL